MRSSVGRGEQPGVEDLIRGRIEGESNEKWSHDYRKERIL